MTVKNHVTSLYSKLNLHTRAEAVAYAWQHGLVQD
jgi:DNA-binding NarL/FixJ family response regulator